MEPPFYADLNLASKYMDKSKIETLGPFSKAIWGVLYRGDDSDKKREDACEIGESFRLTDDLGYMCRSFLLFRGALMEDEWIYDWKEEIGELLNLHGITSASKNMDVALNFSKCSTNFDTRL